MKRDKAQSIIEFCFASVVLMLLLFGMVQTVRWVMMDLAERRYDHERVLTDQHTAGYDAQGQLRSDFHRTRSIDGTVFSR